MTAKTATARARERRRAAVAPPPTDPAPPAAVAATEPAATTGDVVEPMVDLGACEIERWPVERIKPYEKNANTHPENQLKLIMASMQEFGWTMPALVDEAGMLIAGHGRLEAAKRLGLTIVPVIVARGWTDAQKRAYVIADNQIAAKSVWNTELLSVELADLKGLGFDLSLTGFGEDELADLLATPGADDGEDQGRLLNLMDITIAEPRNKPERGDHYLLGGRHHLVCCGVIEDHAQWSPLLGPGTLFAPFPGPFVPFAEKAAEAVFVMVQPDRYIAGHLLDRYEDAHGADSIKRVGNRGA
jgi:hypothetical protein